jgi:SAM-dependent methyltransferase
MDSPSPRETNLRRAHPLAIALVERLRTRTHARILDVGSGSGRNTDALKAAGFAVHSVPDAQLATFSVPPDFDAAISTHALLHGTAVTVAELLARIAHALKAGAPFYATFASTRDARYGKGTRIDDETFAPREGDEKGVAHVYFNERRLRDLLAPHFTIESLEERNVDEIVGRWAHAEKPRGSVHWFVHAH